MHFYFRNQRPHNHYRYLQSIKTSNMNISINAYRLDVLTLNIEKYMSVLQSTLMNSHLSKFVVLFVRLLVKTTNKGKSE